MLLQQTMMEKWKVQEIGLIKFQVSCFSREAWDFIWKNETDSVIVLQLSEH